MASSIPDLYELTARERAIRYRQLARQVDVWAGSALTSECRDAYRHVAEQWVKMADEVDPYHGYHEIPAPEFSQPVSPVPV